MAKNPVSQYFQHIDYNANYSIVWHSIFGRPMLVPNFIVTELEKGSFDPAEHYGPEWYKNEVVDELISDLCEAHILINNYSSERDDIIKLYYQHNCGPHYSTINKVKYLSLIMSEECPFRCKYCIHFANSKHYYNPEKMMSLEIAKSSIDSYLKVAKENTLEEAYINFGGGEPLLNWSIIEQLLPYIKEQSKVNSIPVKLGINTNLALLTEDIAKKLIEYEVEVAASLDGTKPGNDAVRLTKNLTGTYDQIMHGFKIFEKLGHPLDGFAMTVNDDNYPYLDNSVIDLARSLNMSEVRIDIDVVGMVDTPVEDIIGKLTTVYQYAKKTGISVIGFWSRPAENLGLVPEQEDIGFCGAERGNSICVAPSGQVFPCGYSNFELCNYKEIDQIKSANNYQLLLSKRDRRYTDSCTGCPIEGFCRGGCLITKEANESSEKFHRMCELYLGMTYAILRECAGLSL